MKRLTLTFAALAAILLAVPATGSRAAEGAAPAAPAQAAKGAVSPEELKKLLAAHPEIVLDVLRENSAELFAIVEEGARKKREAENKDRVEQELQKPLEVAVDPARVLLGKPDAPVTIVEYSDFQCPFCAKTAEAVSEAMRKLGGKARLVFKNYPLRNHRMAAAAAYFFEAVTLQGKDKALKYYELLFASQDKMEDQGESLLFALAAQAGADTERLKEDLKKPEIAERIRVDVEEFRKLGFSGVPVVVVNGVSLRGQASAEEILDLVKRVEKKK